MWARPSRFRLEQVPGRLQAEGMGLRGRRACHGPATTGPACWEQLHVRTMETKMKILKTHILMQMRHPTMRGLKLFHNKVQSEKFLRIWRGKTHLKFCWVQFQCKPVRFLQGSLWYHRGFSNAANSEKHTWTALIKCLTRSKLLSITWTFRSARQVCQRKQWPKKQLPSHFKASSFSEVVLTLLEKYTGNPAVKGKTKGLLPTWKFKTIFYERQGEHLHATHC